MNIIKDIKATLYDRMGSPVIGVFLGAWLVFNYEIVLILLKSDQKIVTLLEAVNSRLNLSDTLYGPLAFTAASIIIYPWISVLAYGWNRFAIVAKHRVRDLIEGWDTVPFSDFETLKSEMDDKIQSLRERTVSAEVRYENSSKYSADLESQYEGKINSLVDEKSSLEAAILEAQEAAAKSDRDLSNERKKWNEHEWQLRLMMEEYAKLINAYSSTYTLLQDLSKDIYGINTIRDRSALDKRVSTLSNKYRRNEKIIEAGPINIDFLPSYQSVEINIHNVQENLERYSRDQWDLERAREKYGDKLSPFNDIKRGSFGEREEVIS